MAPTACSTCETAAGPTIRIKVDTMNAIPRLGLALTPTQALDLIRTLREELGRAGILAD